MMPMTAPAETAPATPDSHEPDGLELAAMLCSKVCHDVVNPVGAIINGLEVIDDGNDPELREIAFDLIRKSADQASAKIRFSRVAFGAASSSGATIDLSDAEKVAIDYLDRDKIKLDWRLPLIAVPKDQVKLVLNLILTGLTTIPRGGTVTVEGTASNHQLDTLIIRNQGPSPRILDEVERMVTGTGKWSDVQTQSIQSYYTGIIAKTAGMKVHFEWKDDVVSIHAVAEVSSKVVKAEDLKAPESDSVISYATTPGSVA